MREQLGTGSKSTIIAMMRVWRAGRAQPAPQVVTLPQELQHMLQTYIAKIVAAAKAEPEGDLAETRENEAELIAECKGKDAELADQADELKASRTALAAAEGRSSQLQADLDASRVEIARERQTTAFAQVELAKAMLRLESLPRLEADLKQCREALDAERASKTKAELNAAVAIEKAAGLESRLLDVRAAASNQQT